jgi:adenylylsulfate reductase, subunit B
LKEIDISHKKEGINFMTVKVNLELCNACSEFDEPLCVKYCPGDLMAIDNDTGKAYIRNPEECWDCMACVKACPYQALETSLPYQLANYKATLKPRVYKDKIVWKLRDINGVEEVFDIPT